MTDEKVYYCDKCKKNVPIESTKIPTCCGEPMKVAPLSACIKDQGWAEHSRPMEEEEPCKDN
ncbi:MAG TPA: hypothetical protein ENN76_03710 [Euryarchaeota archaeon]|nr:hypothetical protein [Euryarchaeota archaeon]